MAPTPRSDILQFCSPVPAWTFAPEVGALKRWTQEIKQLSRLPFDPHAWAMAGHGIIIEHADSESVANVLPSLAAEAGMQLHLIASNAVVGDADAWLKLASVDTPTMIYLEPGQWMGFKADEVQDGLVFPINPAHDEPQAHAFRCRLASFLADEIGARPVVLVTTLRNIHQLDVALRRASLFDRRIAMPRLSSEECAQAFLAEMGKDLFEDAVAAQPSKLGILLNHEYPDLRRRELMQQALRRLAWRERRKLKFADLVQFAVYGTADMDARIEDAELRRIHSIHEAGHVLVTIQDSQGRHVPECCWVISKGDSCGVTVGCYDKPLEAERDPSYADLVHRIRVQLAGRAAEHLVLGSTAVSSRGARSDLECATSMACSMFGRDGLSPDMATDELAASNLAIFGEHPPTATPDHVRTMAQKFLSDQYLIALRLLRENRLLLDRIAAELNQKIYLDRDALAALVRGQAAA